MVERFRTEITADPAPYKAGMAEAERIAQATAKQMGEAMAGAMQGMQKSMQSSLSNIEGAFGKVQKIVAGAGAVIASGGMFGESISKTVELTKESIALSRALGISTTEAGILSIALGDIYQTSDTLLGANRAITRTLRENEDGIKKLGVATRDQNGQYRNSLDIMLDVNKKLAEFSEGTNRNIEGQKIYKKAWEEVSPVIALTADVMKEAEEKALRLGLAMGEENITAVTKYRAAMNDVGDVMHGVAKGVSDVVMPVLTDLGNWFAETGPARIEIMRKATAIFIAGFYSIQTVVIAVFETIKAFLATAGVLLLKFAETLGFALKGDFSGAKAAWERGTEQQVDIWLAAMKRIRDVAEENRQKTSEAFERGFGVPKFTPTQRAEGGKGSTGGEDKNLGAKWDAELAAARNAYDQMKLQQGSFEQFTLQMESAFWAQKMTLAQGNAALLASVTKKYYDVERQIRKNAYDAEIAELKGRMQAAETTAEQRIAIAGQVAEMEGQRWGRTSKQYKDALADMQKATDAWAKQQREIRDLQADAERNYQISRVELERQNLDALEQLGLIKGDEKVKRLKDLKDIEYAIELGAMQKRLELMAEDPTTDPVKYQEQLNRIRALKEKHVQEMAALDNQAAIESKKTFDKWLDPATDAFEKFVNGCIAGTRKWTDVLKNTLVAVAQQYAAMGVKLLIEWVKTEVLKTQATVAGVTARTSAESAGAAASTASTAGSAIANIGSKAWEAAASVYASIAQIPYVGPFLAPAMAIAAAATVIGFIGKIASASGGFDIPTGMNPITQLHEEEMVLPKGPANVIRDLADGGGGGSGMTVHFHGVQDSKAWWRANEAQVVKTLRDAVRNGRRG